MVLFVLMGRHKKIEFLNQVLWRRPPIHLASQMDLEGLE
jgi:hypothetical protein